MSFLDNKSNQTTNIISHLERPPPILIIFSIYSNGKKLLSFKKSQSEDAVHCIHGLKALSIFWIIYGHEVMGYGLAPTINAMHILDVSE